MLLGTGSVCLRCVAILMLKLFETPLYQIEMGPASVPGREADATEWSVLLESSWITKTVYATAQEAVQVILRAASDPFMATTYDRNDWHAWRAGSQARPRPSILDLATYPVEFLVNPDDILELQFAFVHTYAQLNQGATAFRVGKWTPRPDPRRCEHCFIRRGLCADVDAGVACRLFNRKGELCCRLQQTLAATQRSCLLPPLPPAARFSIDAARVESDKSVSSVISGYGRL